MRADYSDTLPLIEMAEGLCKPLQVNREGLSEQDSAVQQELEEQLRMIHFHRGALAHHTNEPKMALTNYKTFNRLLREQLGETPDQRLGVALNELGVAYLQNNNAAKAEKCLRESITILETVTDATENTPNSISMPMINLGFVLWVQGRQDEAAAVFERTLAAREEAYGVNDTKSFA